MSDRTLQGQIDAALAYEAVFVPGLLGLWVSRVADAARIQPGQRALDVACGTGVLAREMAVRIGSAGHVVGVDPNRGMLEVAKQLASEVEWREGVAESLPFGDHSFDAVVSQFGLMFFTDRCQALREMLRVLTPGGRLVVAVWDVLDSMPAFASEVALLERIAGQQAADALRAPFVLGDRDELSRLFSEAGAAGAEITTHEGTARFPSIRTMVEADLRGWLPVMGVVLNEHEIDHVLREAEQDLISYARTDRRAEFRLSAHLVTVKKSDDPAWNG